MIKLSKKQMYRQYFSTLSQDCLFRIIQEDIVEMNGLEEMAEFARNNAEHMQFGPSFHDCEQEINSIKEHLETAYPFVLQCLIWTLGNRIGDIYDTIDEK